MNSPQQPPAWYDDPHGPGRKRYWDGKSWTDHVVDAQSGAPFDMPGRNQSLQWWQGSLAVIGLAIAGLLIGAIIGSSGTKSTTTTQTATQTVASTITETTTLPAK